MALEDQLGKAIAGCKEESEKEVVREVYAFFDEQRSDIARSRHTDEIYGKVMVVGYDRHEDLGVLFAGSMHEAENALREGIYHPESPVILYEFKSEHRDGKQRITGSGKILLPQEAALRYVDTQARTRILPRPSVV